MLMGLVSASVSHLESASAFRSAWASQLVLVLLSYLVLGFRSEWACLLVMASMSYWA